MFSVKDKTFFNVSDYFDYMAETLGQTPYHHFFKSEKVTSDGLKLHLDVYEHSKQAPTIVFIPGTAIYAMCYAEFMYKLGRAGYNVVGLDPRGHGQSEGVRGDYTMEELMRDVKHAIDFALRRFSKKVSLVGSSQGGIVALYTAAKDTRLNTVVCQNFADLTSQDTTQLTRHPRLFKYMRKLIGNADSLPNASIPMSAYIDLDSIKLKYFGSIRQFIDADPLAVKTISLRALHSLGSTPMAVPMEEVKVPVFVFQGDADTIFPVAYTKKLYERLTCEKEFVLFKGMGHALMSDNVDDILPEILAWFREIYP
ncbi:MAG: alpha/beta fold hydrolase [Chitinophagales bacterium]